MNILMTHPGVPPVPRDALRKLPAQDEALQAAWRLPAQHLERHRIARLQGLLDDGNVRVLLNRLLVERLNEVLLLETDILGEAARVDVGDEIGRASCREGV